MAARTSHLLRSSRRQALLIAAVLPVLVLQAPAAAHAEPAACRAQVVDFAGLQHGELLSAQYAAQGIHLSAVANEGRPNQLVVFDSNRTGTPDPDLQVGLGNLSVIPENVDDVDGDGLVDRVSDSIRGGTQVFAFDAPRTVSSFVIVDVDHGHVSSHHATAYDEHGVVIRRVPISIGADGNVQTVTLDAEGVRRLEITYRDSAGVTGLRLACPSGGEGCTPGYWKQPQHVDSWPAAHAPTDPFSDVFEDAFPGLTMLDVLSQGGGGLAALGRHTVAALLNSGSDGVSYAFSSSQVVAAFDDAYPGSASSYERLKDRFAAENERGCGLS